MNVSREASGAGRSPASASRASDEGIDRTSARRSRRARRQRLGAHRQERPVRPVVRALLDPAQEQRLLRVGQRQAGFRRRHHVVVVREDPPNELAALRLPWFDDGPAIVERLEGAGGNVEPQLGFAFAGVGSVATEAAIGEEWTDLRGEVYRRGARRRGLRGEDDRAEDRAGERGGARAPANHGSDCPTAVWRCQSRAGRRSPLSDPVFTASSVTSTTARPAAG